MNRIVYLDFLQQFIQLVKIYNSNQIHIKIQSLCGRHLYFHQYLSLRQQKSKQQRYEKQNGSFQTFSTTNQVNKAQLADFRKEIRNNISQREPFVPQQENKPISLTNWKKHERKNTQFFEINQRDGNVAKYMARSSPKKSLPGGLNVEEIFNSQKKFIDKNQSQNTFYYQQQRKVDQLFKKDHNDSFSKQDNSFSNLLKPKKSSQALLSRQSGRDQSPINLERFRSWDTKLDLQLKQLNNSKDISFYKYSQQPQKENIYETSKPLQTKDIFNINKNANNFNKFLKSSSPPKFIEKIPLTEIVKMQSYFSQLPTVEITTIPRGYIQELQNLQQTLARVVRQSSQII
ncbi:unnamed protein product (macronuclear) [Paramecium tetraurelia]|uniref:Uncharacterized protein n=1 Tax=Paramecium tetraurelia TaxID=5888 RepID=A0D539_PARTE|nr:uncharacterized protein GSPATT00013603001 [Paramecium tetraurelia]CAK78156.1 unnamed protein product [Paramecium tetraurelia]|eukprot:XP_001445553.1 hypothetical protein (macronuclear) [Paramecium tetraurelia strain d4-2]